MHINNVYDLTNKNIIGGLQALDNPFVRQLANLSMESAKKLKVMSLVLKDKVSNRGEIAQKGVHPSEKSVLDICKLTPLVGGNGARNLLEEVALYRANMLGLNEGDFARKNAYMLMVDYMLASCLCYVEIFDKTSKVDKFFATRNRFIAGNLAKIPDIETNKYVSYLTPYAANYELGQLKILKLNANKKGFRITQPRSALDFNRSIKVTPLFFMATFLEGINELLENNIVKFKYVKDNFTEREFITTKSMKILASYYDDDFVQKMINGSEVKLHRGYIRLPELGISKYDETGVRALNISRITSMEILQDIDSRFIDVDFNTILPCFKSTIDNLRDVNVLSMIYSDLLGQIAPTSSVPELKNAIISFVDGQYAIGTTTALRQIHLYMMGLPQVFKTYNGGKPLQYGSITSRFNLGLAEG